MRVGRIIRTLRNYRQGVDHVGTGPQRADRHRCAGATHVNHNIRRARRGRGRLTFFQTPLLLGGINDAEIVDAGIRLGGLTGAHKIRDGDRRQKADDGHNDHDFHQREAGFTIDFKCFHFLTFFDLWQDPLRVGQRCYDINTFYGLPTGNITAESFRCHTLRG